MVADELWWTDEPNPARELVAGAYAGAVQARGEGRSRKCDAGRALRELKPWPAVPGLPWRVDAESGHRRRVAPRGRERGAAMGAARGRRIQRTESGRAACVAGPKARRWPGKREMEIFVFIFKEISKSSFQIPF